MARGTTLRLDDATREKICTAIARGHGVHHAVRLAGVALSTFQRWARQGREDLEAVTPLSRPDRRRRHSPYAQLIEGIEAARLQAEATGVDALRSLVVGEAERTVACPECGHDVRVSVQVAQCFQAVKFWLESRGRERWGQRIAVEVQRTISPGEFDEAVRLMAESLERAVRATIQDTDLALRVLEAIGREWSAMLLARFPEIYEPAVADVGAIANREPRRLPAGEGDVA